MLKIIKKNNYFLSLPKALTIIYLIFPLSIPLSKLLAKRRIKPNHITLFSWFLVIIAAFFFLFDKWLYLALGAVFFYLSNLLDQVDGNVARLTNRVTVFGGYFDNITDSARKIICFIPLLYSQFFLQGGKGLLFLGLLFVIIHYGLHLIVNFIRKHKKRQDSSSLKEWLDAKGVVYSLFDKPDEALVIFIVGPLLNQFIVCFIIALILFLVFSVLFKIKLLFPNKNDK
jgi:phosphatidylglycerophosphate synthase